MDQDDKIQKAIFGYAYSLLARKRYTVAELQKKVTRKFPGQIKGIEETLQRLKKHHYLDDMEYAGLFIESKLKRHPQSIKLLKWNLRKKGLDSDTIERSLNEENINEAEMARLAAQKKQKSLARLPMAKQKEKLYRFLLSRGFSSSVIFQVANKENGDL